MKQLLILSGKGGTGKTTIASAFIQLQGAKVYGDCDVDAPNLHLALRQKSIPKKTDYYGMDKAVIDVKRCISCGACMTQCRFDAIGFTAGRYQVKPYSCEGCGVCHLVCPTGAIAMVSDVAGELMLYEVDHTFSTATLKMGSGTSGKLVTEVKGQLKGHEDSLVIMDGSPGIGCPVIASLNGADMVLIVTEPTISGVSDMKRIVKTARRFKMTLAVLINKYDINEMHTKAIEAFCMAQKIPLVGRVPFDAQVTRCLNSGISIIETDTEASKAIQAAFIKSKSIIQLEEAI